MKKHKILLLTIAAILLFVGTIFATNFLLNAFAKKDVQIPNLVGKEQSQAKIEAESSNLQFIIGDEAFSKDVPAGCIISQEPPYAENFAVKEESIITVVISKGRNLVGVPKVVGKTEDEAVKELEELGLVVSIPDENRVYDKKVQAGIVIKQSVEAKEEIDAGETIVLTVSKGIETVIVPDLTGKTLDEAKGIITENGLKLKEVWINVDENFADGIVLYQDIDPNKEVPKDSFINITINSLPTEKKGIINVNLKSLLGTGYKLEYENILDENGNPVLNENGEPTQKVKDVKLEIKVNNQTIYSEMQNPLVESISTEFTNKGYVEIKVFVNGYNMKETGLYLEEETVCNIDKAD